MSKPQFDPGTTTYFWQSLLPSGETLQIQTKNPIPFEMSHALNVAEVISVQLFPRRPDDHV